MSKHTTIESQHCDCNVEQAAADPRQRVSSHRTSEGRVVYFRCYCGATRLMTLRWASLSAE